MVSNTQGIKETAEDWDIMRVKESQSIHEPTVAIVQQMQMKVDF